MKCPPLVANELSAFARKLSRLLVLALKGGPYGGSSGVPFLCRGAGDEGAGSDIARHRWTPEMGLGGRDPRDLVPADAPLESSRPRSVPGPPLDSLRNFHLSALLRRQGGQTGPE